MQELALSHQKNQGVSRPLRFSQGLDLDDKSNLSFGFSFIDFAFSTQWRRSPTFSTQWHRFGIFPAVLSWTWLTTIFLIPLPCHAEIPFAFFFFGFLVWFDLRLELVTSMFESSFFCFLYLRRLRFGFLFFSFQQFRFFFFFFWRLFELKSLWVLFELKRKERRKKKKMKKTRPDPT